MAFDERIAFILTRAALKTHMKARIVYKVEYVAFVYICTPICISDGSHR